MAPRPALPHGPKAARACARLVLARLLAALLAALLAGCAQAPAPPSGQGQLDAAPALRSAPAAADLEAVRALRQAGRPEDAVAEANRLILRTPRQPQPFVERGLSLALLGHMERALEDYRTALMLDPRHAPALLAQGDAFFLLDQPRAAEASFTRAIQLARTTPWPGSTGAWRGTNRADTRKPRRTSPAPSPWTPGRPRPTRTGAWHARKWAMCVACARTMDGPAPWGNANA